MSPLCSEDAGPVSQPVQYVAGRLLPAGGPDFATRLVLDRGEIVYRTGAHSSFLSLLILRALFRMISRDYTVSTPQKIYNNNKRLVGRGKNSAEAGAAISVLVFRSINTNSYSGWMAEWLCTGLQSRLQRFDSASSLQV